MAFGRRRLSKRGGENHEDPLAHQRAAALTTRTDNCAALKGKSPGRYGTFPKFEFFGVGLGFADLDCASASSLAGLPIDPIGILS